MPQQTAEASKLPVTMENIGRLPFSESLVDMLMEELDRKLAGRSIASLAETLPECSDPYQQAIGDQLSSIISSCVVYALRIHASDLLTWSHSHA